MLQPRFQTAKIRAIVFIGLLMLSNRANAEIVVLYNGTGLPTNQTWLAFAANGLTFSQSAQAGGVQLITDFDVSAGYSNYTPLGSIRNTQFPILNRSTGYELSFALTLGSEAHNNLNRAGFSVTLLGSDSQGIEIGFWQDQVWAQSGPLFQRAESANVDTTQPRNYRLRVEESSYSLFEGNNLLLNNNLRNYSSSGILPYSLPNFLFLGDNTSSASATALLGVVTLQTNLIAVPEPSSLTLMTMVGALGFSRFRYRRNSLVHRSIR
jgi:PEP-CTERM motif